jgi:signal transduction histidine kinase
MKQDAFRRDGLGGQITKIVVLALGGLILFGGFFLHAAIKELLVSQFDQALLTKAQTLTRFAEAGRTGINLSFTEEPLPEFQAGEDSEYYQVWFKDGSVLARSPSLDLGQELLQRPQSDQQVEFFPLDLPDGRAGRAVALQLNSGDDPGSEGFMINLTLARSSEDLNQILGKLIFGFVAGGAGLLALAWVVVRGAARTALRPVDALAAEVSEIDADSLESRISVETLPVDLQAIAGQINELVERLEATFARERRFASNAAHELLTPVAELRIASDNALDWPDDPEATAGLAKQSCELAEQMGHVVRSLLALSRAEAHLTPVESKPFDFDEVVRKLLDSFQPKIDSRKLQFTHEFPERMRMSSDRVIVQSILSNLLLNAIEYSADSSLITISGEVDSDAIELRIRNRAEQISVEDLEYFCEAFWRADSARSSREHTGLGLALSLAFVRLLGGELRFEIEDDETVVTILSLPKGHQPQE